jgi:polysaccharide export outer membrane protein
MFTYFLLSGCATSNKNKITALDTSPTQEKALQEVRVKEFILGPGDRIEIMVYRHDDLTMTVQIDSSGKIMYPLVGDIHASGLSIFQLRDIIRDGLSEYLVDPQVSVCVLSVQSQKVIVLGEVKNPGLFSLEMPMDTIEAISRAGGFSLDAKQNSVLLIRGGMNDPQLIKLDIKSFLKAQDMSQNVVLHNGDIIYVPSSYIADVSRFFDHVSSIIRPFLQLETIYYLGQTIERGGTVVPIPIE